MEVSKDRRNSEVGYVCVLKNRFTKEVEYVSLQDIRLVDNGQTLKDYILENESQKKNLEEQILSLKQLLKEYQENSTKAIENAIKASSAALEVAQKQSIQIEILNQEVFSNE